MSVTTANVTKLFGNGGMQHTNTSSYSPSTFFGHRPAQSQYMRAVAPETIYASTQTAQLTPEEASFQKDIKGAVDVILAAAQMASFAESDRPNQYNLVVSPELAKQSNEAAKQATSQHPKFQREIEKGVHAFFNSAAAQKALERAEKAPKQSISEDAVNNAVNEALTTAKAAFFYPTKDDANRATEAQQEAAVQSALSIPVLAR